MAGRIGCQPEARREHEPKLKPPAITAKARSRPPGLGEGGETVIGLSHFRAIHLA